MIAKIEFKGTTEVHIPDWYFDEEIDEYLENFIDKNICGAMVNEYDWAFLEEEKT